MLPPSFPKRKKSTNSKNNIDLNKKQKTQSLINSPSKSKKKSKESKVLSNLLRRLRPQPSRRITLCLRPEQWLSESLNFLGSTLVLKVRILFVFKKVKELSFKQVPSVNNAQRCQRKSKTSTFLCSRKCSDSTTNESVLRPSLRQRDSSSRTPRLLWTPKSIWCWTCSKRLILMTYPRDHRIETNPQLNITKNR